MRIQLIQLWLAAILLWPVCNLPSAALAEGYRFRVGVIAPLSGSFAEYGSAVRNGIKLAEQDDPSLAEAVKFIFEDDQYDPKKAITAFNHLHEAEEVDEIFLWGNESALTIAPLAERHQLPALLVAQDPSAGLKSHYAIRFINPAEDFSRVTIRYLADQGFKRIGIVQSEISFFNVMIAGLYRFKTPEQTIEVLDSFNPSDGDFRTVISQLKARPFDVLGVYLIPTQLIQFFRQAKELQFEAKTFGTTPFENSKVIKSALQYMNGAIYSQIAVSPEFEQRYLSAYGDNIQISYAANAYDFARLTARLFKNSKHKPYPQTILAKYAAVSSEKGVCGEFAYRDSLTAGDYFEFPIVLKRIEGDRFVEIK